MTKKSKQQEIKLLDLYPLPETWEWVTVKDAGAPEKNAIVDGPFGSNLKVRDYVENGPVPVLTTKNLNGSVEGIRYISQDKFEELIRSAVYPGDILMAKIGSCGKTGIYPQGRPPAMIPANLLKVTLNKNFFLKYVFYYFSTSYFQNQLKTITKATAQPAFGVTNFRKLPLPFAPKNEQKRIVAEIEKQFSRLDEAVENLKRVKVNLKRYKASVLKAAVEGKLTEDWRAKHPDVEPADKLLGRILAERRKKWEEAELSKMKKAGKEPKDDKWKKKYKEPSQADISTLDELPNGWNWLTSDQLFWFVTSGSRGWAKYYSDSGAVFLRIGNLDHDTVSLDLKKVQFVKPPRGAEGTRTRVEENDILISITADVGMIGIVQKGFGEAYINQHISLARPVSTINSLYLAWYLTSRLGQNQFGVLQRGATKAGLGLDDIRSVKIPMPPFEEQEEIISQMEKRLSVVDEIEIEADKNLKRSVRLRQSILKKAFSGRLIQSKEA